MKTMKRKTTRSEELFYIAMICFGFVMLILMLVPKPSITEVEKIPVFGRWMAEQQKAQMYERKQACEDYKRNTPESSQHEYVKRISCDSYVLPMVKEK